MRFRELTTVQRPIPPPVDLDAGRLDLTRAALAGGFVVGALLVSLAGWWLFGLATNGLVQFFGLAVGALGLVLGAAVIYIAVTEWFDHRRRIAEWHTTSLATWRELGGAEQSHTLTEWDLSADNPAHVLLAALMVYRQVQAGAELAYSTRRLVGPYFLAGRRVGNLSKLAAEEMGRRFARLGLVEGRSPGDAGAWVPQSADDILDIIERHW